MKRFQPVLLVIFAQMASIAACRVARAETAADSAAASQQPARPAAQLPMSRQDAELMLREAHGAIEQGRLDDAEKILSRVENAHVRFPIIHVGPTPDSVRRELTRAQRLRVASKSLSREQPAGAKRYLPFARNGSGQTNAATDPFGGRKPGTDQLPATSSAVPQPAAPVTTGRGLAGVSAPATLPSEPQSTQPQSVGNPFATAGKPAATNSTALASTPSASESPLNYAAADTLSDADSRNTAVPAAPTQTTSVPPSAPSANPSWALPDAPRPRGASDYRLAANGSGLTPPRRPASISSAIPPSTAAPSKQQAQQHLSAARKALQSGDIDLAEKLTQAANSVGVAESQFLPDEDRPSLVAWDIAQAKQKDSRPQPRVAPLPAGTSRYETQPTPSVAREALPRARQSDVVQAGYRDDDRAAQTAPPPPVPLPPVARTSQPRPLPPTNQPAHDGPQMMAARPADPVAKPARPEVTAPPAEEIPLPPSANTPPAADPYAVPRDAAKDAQLEAPNVETSPAETITSDIPQPLSKQQAAPAKPRKSLIDSADEAQQVLLRKVYAEIEKRESEAVRLRAKDPERAAAALREAQQLVKDSKLPESSQRVLSRRIDKALNDTQKHAKTHGAQIELDKENKAVSNDIERDREMKLKLQQKIAEHVDDFNRLTHEQRYAEAEIVARRLIEMAPNNPVAQQIWINAKFIRREMMNRQVADKKEDAFWEQMHAVEKSATNPVAADGEEVVYDQKLWTDFVAKRKGSKDRTQRRSERELEIERRLQTPVLLCYQDTPLTEVMHNLSELTGINMHLDPRGLSQEGINSDTPISINLSKEVSLKSALNLVLEPLHLTYVINDEVLKITSEQLRDGELITKPYNVADLVTPIPNFVPSSNMGLQGLIQESMASASEMRGSFGIGNTGPTVLVNDRKQKPATGSNGQVLAQQLGSPPQTSSPHGASSPTVPIGGGPGGMGGAANADFDSLIDLIVSTVSQDTWAENGGGQAEIRPFPTNLSLVISQTQAVHEEIADLLQQLRRLQDLQVTIEVRFIQLNDNFFERIGIDFDMDINDNGFDGTTTSNLQPFGPNSNTVGLIQAASAGTFPTFTSDLDIPFRQGSFNVATPLFGGFDANSAANFGFAILSDIEAFFLIQAAQGDSRTNVLNAPKITLFNGQQAFVADATQRPFVVGVIPVVGEFAAAQQPVIVVLNEGTMMTIQAVVSDDRRYVRMTIVPFFTKIGNVDTFTFEGSSSSTSSSSSTDDDDDGKNEKKDESKANTNSGVTVQLPSLSFISVVTTVSVPDGGTVLLGGIKQLSEGRNEFGVPLLSKVPYINRLFKNVGIGRETESIMMMVTPRIIIQEEEEARLGYTPQ